MSTTTTTTDSEQGEDTPPQVLGGRIVSESGGTLELSEAEPMDAPGGVQATEYGAAFGPLELIAYPDSTARVGGLSFDQPTGFIDSLFGNLGDGLFALAPMAAATRAGDARDEADETTRLSRRDLLVAAGGAGAILAGTQTARAASTTRSRATFATLQNPAGLRIRVRDRVADLLPTDETYYTYVDGTRYSRFSAANTDSYGDVLPELTGTTVVGPKGAAGGALSFLDSKSKAYQGVELSKPIPDAAVGERVLITDNDILVESVQSVGSGGTTLTINGVSIPHEHEDANSPRGFYGIHNGSLVYEVGSDAPAGQTATLTVYADQIDELVDDIERSVL